MEIMDTGEGQEEELVVITMEEEKKEESQAIVSLNAMLGDVQEGSGTMRIKGTTGSKTLHNLLDMGSSHDFINDKFSKVATAQTSEIQPLQVTVANRIKEQGTRMIKGFTSTMEGRTFSTDVVLFPLVGFDMVMGMQWLKTLGPITWNFSNLTVEFVKDGQKVMLFACKGVKNQLLGRERGSTHSKDIQTYCIHITPNMEGSSCYALNLEEETSASVPTSYWKSIQNW